MTVVQTLGRLGFLGTSRGRGGGMSLTRSPDQISLGAVLRATETGMVIVEGAGAAGWPAR